MIFASLGSLSGTSERSGLVWVAIFAGIGGLIVFIGLLLEKFSTRDWYRSQTVLKRWKRIGTIGWFILMLGIFWEIVSAGAFAVKEELAIKQIRKNAIKNDPANLPIKSITARVFLKLLETNAPSSYNEIKTQSEEAKFGGHFNILDKKGGLIAVLSCKEFDIDFQIQPVKAKGISMVFEWPTIDRWTGFEGQRIQRNLSTLEFDKEVAGAMAWFPDCKMPLEINGGSCVLVINGGIQRRFSIPRHSDEMFLINTNSP